MKKNIRTVNLANFCHLLSKTFTFTTLLFYVFACKWINKIVFQWASESPALYFLQHKIVIGSSSCMFLFRAPLLWFLCSSFHSLQSIKQNISFTKLNISFTELISPSVNYLLEGKMTLSTKYLLHQFLLYLDWLVCNI